MKKTRVKKNKKSYKLKRPVRIKRMGKVNLGGIAFNMYEIKG